jgi:transposase
VHAAEQDRPDVARRRLWWRRFQPRLDVERLVFIDETWAKTNMTRLSGWWPRGERLVAKVPHGHWHTLTVLAALRADRIAAPCVFDGPINGESFTAYVREILVLDNLGSHKGAEVRSLIRGAGCHLAFLPPYSPDLNPIEQAFAKLKAHLRTAAAISDAIATAIGHFSAQECTNYFRNAGYGST